MRRFLCLTIPAGISGYVTHELLGWTGWFLLGLPLAFIWGWNFDAIYNRYLKGPDEEE